MKTIPKSLYKELKEIALQTAEEFKRKGVILPSIDNRGQTIIGDFTIVKHGDQYTIKDYRGEVYFEAMNLPETAILVANDLALGKIVDKKILETDRWYGFKQFEEDHARYISRKKMGGLAEFRAQTAAEQKQHYRREQAKRFAKLRNLV